MILLHIWFTKMFKNVIKIYIHSMYMRYMLRPHRAIFREHIIKKSTALCSKYWCYVMFVLPVVLRPFCAAPLVVCFMCSFAFLVWSNSLVHEHPGQWALLRPRITSLLETGVPGRQLALSLISGFEGLNPVRNPSHRTGWFRGNSGHAWFESRPWRQLSQIKSPCR
jgi:hypothetical protein